jgi:O-antigen/teichoic acid export membrane protein
MLVVNFGAAAAVIFGNIVLIPIYGVAGAAACSAAVSTAMLLLMHAWKRNASQLDR